MAVRLYRSETAIGPSADSMRRRRPRGSTTAAGWKVNDLKCDGLERPLQLSRRFRANVGQRHLADWRME
jgi:hypothetical protein